MKLLERNKCLEDLTRWFHAATEQAGCIALVGGEAQQVVEDIARAPTPEFPGISLEARRAINLAAIAYAEVLCERLNVIEKPLLQMAREATARRTAADAPAAWAARPVR